MNATIIYDNSAKKGFQSGWGFSCLANSRILFDTGEAAEPILRNMKQLKINVENLEAIIISHDHWDHTGGLWDLLKMHKGLSVYACPGFSSEFKNRVFQLGGVLLESEKHRKINQTFSLTGEIAGEYNNNFIQEQSLIVNTDNGLSIITGCSHPGIITIVEKILNLYRRQHIYTILGGFHLMNKSEQEIQSIAITLKKMGVEKVGPTHCSGSLAQTIFHHIFGKQFIHISAGKVFAL